MQVNLVPTKKKFQYTKLLSKNLYSVDFTSLNRGENYNLSLQLINCNSYGDNVKWKTGQSHLIALCIIVPPKIFEQQPTTTNQKKKC